MLGWVFLFLECVMEAILGVVSKKLSLYVRNMREIMGSNTVRMGVNVIAGALFVLLMTRSFSGFQVDGAVLAVGLLGGVANVVTNVFWYLSVRSGAYMLTGVFMSMGMFIPVFLSNIFFQEEMRIIQVVGLLLMFAACCLISAYNSRLTGRTTWKAIVYGILSCIGVGLQDFSTKVFTYVCPGYDASVFSFYAFVFTTLLFLLLTVIWFLRSPIPWKMPQKLEKTHRQALSRDEQGNRLGAGQVAVVLLQRSRESLQDPDQDESVHTSVQGFMKKNLAPLIASGLLLLGTILLRTLCAPLIPAIVMFPIMKGLSLIFGLLCSAVFMGEKPNRQCYIGVGIAVVAMVIVSVF